MRTSKVAIIVVILVFTFALAGIVIYTSQTNTAVTAPVPSPVQESLPPTTTPTPSEQTIQGEILTVATTPVGYKDSYVATVEQTDGTSALVYITENTTIQNAQGTEVTRTSLRAGTEIIAVTTPAEGGYEAVQIQITPATGTSTPAALPTRTVPTTSPTEE